MPFFAIQECGTIFDILRQRLQQQRLDGACLPTAVDAVQWLGAVQSQDYAGAKWAIAQRCQFVTSAAVDQAIDKGMLIRTHVLRPTWHFVIPEDLRWLLTLTAPRVHAANAFQYRKYALDKDVFAQSETVLTQVLQGGQFLTRAELATALTQAGIDTQDGVRLSCLLMHAELEGLICNGPLRGIYHTYALVEERVVPTSQPERDEALARLTQRYFTSHGPATLGDFIWWSGLAPVDARRGLDIVQSQLISETVNQQTYWSAPTPITTRQQIPSMLLLPNYDEYIVGYTDRTALMEHVPTGGVNLRENLLFSHTVIEHGQVTGIWKRTIKKHAVNMEVQFFTEPSAAQKQAFVTAAEQYGRFLQTDVMFK
jgi:Winged helix DNA-binding domain